jgi:hypothetical protein
MASFPLESCTGLTAVRGNSLVGFTGLVSVSTQLIVIIVTNHATTQYAPQQAGSLKDVRFFILATFIQQPLI